jgi:hypothetical protein
LDACGQAFLPGGGDFGWQVLGVEAGVAMTGLCRSPGETARGVLLPTLAERAGMPLTRAAGLYDGAARCAALTGSALGGVLIAVLGAENVLLVDAATFAVAAPLFAFGVRGLPEAQPQRQVESASLRAYRRELAECYRFLAAAPLLLGLCLMTLVTRGLDQGWSAVLLPVHAREELDGSIDLGLLNAAFGICALTGALVYGAVGSRFRRWPVFTIAFLIVGLPRFVVAAFTDTFTPLAVIMAVEGLACGVLNPIMATVTYETVPQELRSRVLSATTAAVQLVTPLGGLAAGFLVDSAGLPCALLTIGGAEHSGPCPGRPGALLGRHEGRAVDASLGLVPLRERRVDGAREGLHLLGAAGADRADRCRLGSGDRRVQPDLGGGAPALGDKDGPDRVEGDDQPDPCPVQLDGLALQVRGSASAAQHRSGCGLCVSDSHGWVPPIVN